MPKIATATIIVLCLATASGCWFIYGIEHQRNVRESREIEARDVAARELEMYQAWRYATRYDAFKNALSLHLREGAKNGQIILRVNPAELWDATVWVKSFQRLDVKSAGKSAKFGNASYQVSSIIIWRTRELELRSVTAQSRLEKMDGPGDWIASEWTFGPIEVSSDDAYHGDFPVEPVKTRE